ncbi:hypothetical protein BEP19_04685 [Ammoniphilus oxalaticus]|uniref:YolD-like family protein n=1 Tax=Ammoniphilus oxalaticus TaxID=66863 RepID=A0A419SM66_9BACL|nr:hypothetical protein BEP19_04685 [Ammoniphilus oxalaticus]
MIKDRGNIKWTSMMLAEHRGLLQQLEESARDVNPPVKSAEELAELAEQAAWALEQRRIVTISYWQNKRKQTTSGLIKQIDRRTQALMIVTECGGVSWIAAKTIFSFE